MTRSAAYLDSCRLSGHLDSYRHGSIGTGREEKENCSGEGRPGTGEQRYICNSTISAFSMKRQDAQLRWRMVGLSNNERT